MRSLYKVYSNTLGMVGLLIEATLPLPQIAVNARSRSCKGFRVSVLGMWLLGDFFKMLWFFTSATPIPWAFKLCGIFQAGCDVFLGVQYLMYGNGETAVLKEHAMAQFYPGSSQKPTFAWKANGRATPSGRRTPVNDKI